MFLFKIEKPRENNVGNEQLTNQKKRLGLKKDNTLENSMAFKRSTEKRVCQRDKLSFKTQISVDRVHKLISVPRGKNTLAGKIQNPKRKNTQNLPIPPKLIN